METIECPNCARTIKIEPEIHAKNYVNAGHGTIVDPFKRPNKIQCACGKYI